MPAARRRRLRTRSRLCEKIADDGRAEMGCGQPDLIPSWSQYPLDLGDSRGSIVTITSARSGKVVGGKVRESKAVRRRLDGWPGYSKSIRFCPLWSPTSAPSVNSRRIATTLPMAMSLPSQSFTAFPGDSFGRAREGLRNLMGNSYVLPSSSVSAFSNNRQSNASPSTRSGHPYGVSPITTAP